MSLLTGDGGDNRIMANARVQRAVLTLRAGDAPGHRDRAPADHRVENLA
jgi:hypothetical protein